jgi:hypothetical protein
MSTPTLAGNTVGRSDFQPQLWMNVLGVDEYRQNRVWFVNTRPGRLA